MVGASMAMRKWALDWKRKQGLTLAEALWAMAHTYFWTINGVEQAYTAGYQKEATVQDMVKAMVLNINGNVPGVVATAERGKVVLTSTVPGCAFTIEPGYEDEEVETSPCPRADWYQAQHDRRHAIWKESQEPSYYDDRWDDYDTDDPKYRKALEVMDKVGPITVRLGPSRTFSLEPCPTCNLLGRQCSGCAGRFTYGEFGQ